MHNTNRALRGGTKHKASCGKKGQGDNRNATRKDGKPVQKPRRPREPQAPKEATQEQLNNLLFRFGGPKQKDKKK